MIVETAGGRNYSATELEGWLTDAGFTNAHTIPLDAAGANGAVVARKDSHHTR